MPPQVLTPDLCVVGGGAAGFAVAAGAAAFGVSVVLIEQDGTGSDGLTGPRMQAQALLAAGRVAQTVREAATFGIAAGRPRIDQARLRRHLDEVVTGIAPNLSAARLGALGVRVVAAQARFVDRTTIAAGDDLRVRARRTVLATGARPVLPGIDGLDAVPCLTTETICDLRSRPERLLVLGGGPDAVELAQAHRRLGSEVTLVAPDTFLPAVDPELAGHLARALAAEGVILRLSIRVQRVDTTAAGIVLTLADGERISGTQCLVAVGRRPALDTLGLDAAGIAHDATGITVDASLRTSNARVYAVGDCAAGPHGGERPAPLAGHQAAVVLQAALFRRRARAETQAVPRLVLTDPEIATVGLDEAAARVAGQAVRIERWPFSENDRARADRRTAGGIKLVLDRSGRILGAGIVGAHARELILPWVLAIRNRLDLADMRDVIVPWPSYSEVSPRAAFGFYTDLPRRPAIRRMLRWLRLLG